MNRDGEGRGKIQHLPVFVVQLALQISMDVMDHPSTHGYDSVEKPVSCRGVDGS